MHRKQKMIPWGYIITGLLLFGLVIGLLAAASAIAAPVARASTGYLGPAVSAARSLAS